jgi:hypothetical protein
MSSVVKAHLVSGGFIFAGIILYIANLAYSDRFWWHTAPKGTDTSTFKTILSMEIEEKDKLMSKSKTYMYLTIGSVCLILPTLVLMLSTVTVKRPNEFLSKYYKTSLTICSMLFVLMASFACGVGFFNSHEFFEEVGRRRAPFKLEAKQAGTNLDGLAKTNPDYKNALDFLDGIDKYNYVRITLSVAAFLITVIGMSIAEVKSKVIHAYFKSDSEKSFVSVVQV